MRYPPALLDEIRARLPASSVVGRKVRLKKAGREWKGLSPFNAEKTPSFFVNDEKAFFHCFSSGRHGDVFDFLIETEGLSFPEAVERLAAEAGVTLPKASPEAEREAEARRSLAEVVEMAARFFEAALREEVGAAARAYLDCRGIGQKLRATFRLGYAPDDRTALVRHLRGQGIADDAMVDAGLAIRPDDGRPIYDRFRGRVMFPIADAKGRVVGFGGRALDPDQQPKYLNSPDGPLFHKGRLLYNLHRARGPAHERGGLIVVEGYTDAIALHEAGFPHVVAPLGTALTEDQLALLWRMADEPVLCFDGDAAGRKAAYRVVDLALSRLAPDKSLRFALLPAGRDPDDLARSGGAEAVARVLDGARPLADMLWAREIAAGPLDTPERRAALERRLEQAVDTIPDKHDRYHYRQEIRNRLRAAFSGRAARSLPPRQLYGPASGPARRYAPITVDAELQASIARLMARPAPEPGSFDGDAEGAAA